jgi:hypothetical protein
MSGVADLYYVAWRRGQTKKDRRVDGYFLIPCKEFVCEACSGSSGLYPLPPGRYVASNYRDRTDPVMVRDDVGFSVDLSDHYDPVAGRTRSLPRIHPDGGKPGTEGCIGILSRVAECRDHLKGLLSGAGATLSLLVVPSPDSSQTSLALALLGSLDGE